MGLPAFGSRILQHLPGALPALAVAALPKSHFSLGAFSAPWLLFSTDVHVRRGEVDQRRRILVGT